MIPRKILIVGIGNLLMGDDGLGSTAIKILEAMRLPKWVDIEDIGSALHSLISSRLKEYEKIIFVDAIKRGSKPGTLHYYKLEIEILEDNVLEEMFGLHEAGILEILRLNKALNFLPREIIIMGCEPSDIEEFSINLSQPVRKALPKLLHCLLLEIEKTCSVG